MVDSTLQGEIDEQAVKDYGQQLTQREEFRENLQQFIGAENADGIMHFEMEFETDKLEESILFKNIESNIDDKLFEFTERSVSDNIRMCFKNVPTILIKSQDGNSFGNGGSTIKAAKEFYQEQTEPERMNAQSIVNKLMCKFKTPLTDLKIIPLIDVDIIETVDAGTGKTTTNTNTSEADSIKLQPQAALKGSVGGVTALLEIQKSVSAGTTDIEAALTIIEEIFGIERELAREMLGTPDKIEDNVNR